MIVLILSLY